MLILKTFLQDCGKEEFHSIPFLIKKDVYNHELQLFTDSSGAADKGFGCMFQNQWAYGAWGQTELFSSKFSPNTALLELFAIVVAVEIWAPQLSGTSIILRSDSMAAVNMINAMKAEIPAAQLLLKHLAINCLRKQIFCKAIHVEGTRNVLSNSLSRLKIGQFHSLHPTANSQPEPLPSNLWPPVWSQKQMVPVKNR